MEKKEIKKNLRWAGFELGVLSTKCPLLYPLHHWVAVDFCPNSIDNKQKDKQNLEKVAWVARICVPNLGWNQCFFQLLIAMWKIMKYVSKRINEENSFRKCTYHIHVAYVIIVACSGYLWSCEQDRTCGSCKIGHWKR